MMMTPRTVSTINTKVEVLALLTEDDLKGMTLAALRKKLSETGISRIEREGGLTVAVNSARKVEVIQAIRDLTKKERIIAQVAPELNSMEESELLDLKDTDRTWADSNVVAKFYFEAIKKYTMMSQWDGTKQTFKAPGAVLNHYATKMSIRFVTLARLGGGEDLTPETKQRFRSAVLTEMRRLGKMDECEWYGVQLLSNIEAIRAQIFDGMREVSDVTKQNATKRLQKRALNVEQVDTTLMVERAYKSLSTLTDTTPSYKWREVSCALAFVTGRRMAELHSSAVFTEVDEYTVSFTGQAKTKGEQAARYSDNPSYEIPTLIPSKYVVNALKWLDDNGKRLDEVEAVNPKYAKELGVYVKNDWYSSTMPTVLANDSKRGAREKHCTYHKLRQLYALSAVDSFKPDNIYVNAFMSQILGHSAWDTQTSQRYERDMELMKDSKTSTR